MATLRRARTLSASINCAPKDVYEFVSNPANLPKWAKALCRSIRMESGKWVVETPQGPIAIRFVEKNAYGILDHDVQPSSGPAVFVPMRVVPNGRGSEVLLTLFQQPGMSDEDVAKDAALVEQDLQTLKMVVEEAGLANVSG